MAIGSSQRSRCSGELVPEGSAASTAGDGRPASGGPQYLCPAIRSSFTFGEIPSKHFDAFVRGTIHHFRTASNGVVEVAFEGWPFYGEIISSALGHDASLFGVSVALIFVILLLVRQGWGGGRDRPCGRPDGGEIT